MNELELKSYAKINLTLDIIRKLPDNYHEIKSVMQQVSLYDVLNFRKINDDEIIINGFPSIKKEENIIYKSAMILKGLFNFEDGVEVTVTKNIPLGSGLAGGSGNAAATLKALNTLWGFNLKDEDLIEIAREIGMDVPFHIIGKTCLTEGRGDVIKKIGLVPEMYVLVIAPGFAVSTKEAYGLVEEKKGEIKTKSMIEAINKSALNEIANNLHNDFEIHIFKKYPKIKEIKEQLIRNNALNALMSGSGSSVFGIFKDKESLDKAYDALKGKYNFITRTEAIR